MATHSSILAWRIPWMEELGGLQSTDRNESDTTEQLHFDLKSSSSRRQILQWLQRFHSCQIPFCLQISRSWL